MLRRFFLISTSSLAFLGSLTFATHAADPNYDPYNGAPPADWSGAYVGAMFGYIWGNFDPNASTSVDANGFLIGGYGGVNFQSGSLVFGAEADLGITSLDGSSGNNTANADWVGGVRGRLGVAIDRHLLYGTAGFGFASADMDLGGPSESNTHLGIVAGFGVESMLNRSVSAKLEYLYSGYNSQGYRGFESDLNTHTIRGGIGYHF